MKKDKLLFICKICLIVLAVVFIVIAICTRLENNLYLLLSLACSLMFNVLNLIKPSSQNKNKE